MAAKKKRQPKKKRTTKKRPAKKRAAKKKRQPKTKRQAKKKPRRAPGIEQLYPWVARGIDWANGVLAGDVPANRLVRLACERFERDLARQGDADFPYYFDPDEAERWLEHIARLKHVRGKLAGEYFEPAPWQCFITLNLYGWRANETGERRFSTGYTEVPRGNGKSLFAAALGLGHLTIDGEIGAEVYCGATSEKQAREVFIPARGMCLNNTAFRNEYGIEVDPKSRTLHILESGSRFEKLIGDPGDGAGASCAIIDEYHEHRTDDMVETMRGGMNKRTQPLMFIITTAGSDLGGPCYDLHLDCVKLLEGQIEDDEIFAIIFGIDLPDDEKGIAGDRWDTEEALVKANPNWPMMNQRLLLAELREARRNPRKQAAYKTKHLNIWVGAGVAWMNMLKFQACGKRGLDIETFRGWDLLVGLDLASKIDLASMAMLFRSPGRDRYAAFMKRWLPEERLKGEDKDAKRYLGWYEKGLLEPTPGDIIDLDLIEDALLALRGRFNVGEVGYDPFQATQLVTHMSDEGFEMVEVPATPKQYTEPMNELERVIYARLFEYDARDEALVWQMGNVIAKRGRSEALFPTKERAASKIDDIIALINAMNRAIAPGDDADELTGSEIA